MESVLLPPSDPGKTHKQRRIGVGGCLLIITGLMVLLVLVGVVGFLIWSRAAAQRVEDQLADVRAAGHPTTPEELEAYYKYPPKDEDVTLLILTAIRQLDTPDHKAAAENLPLVDSDEKEIPPPGQPWDDRAASRNLLEQYSQPLQMLHEAAARGGKTRFPSRFEDGVLMLMEHPYQFRAAAKLLALETHVRAHEGDAHGAAQSIRTLLSLARSIERDPVVVSQLVGWACSGVGLRHILELLPHVRFSDEDLTMLQRELRKERIADGLRHSLIGDRVSGIDAMRHSEKLRNSAEYSDMPKLVTPTNAAMQLYLETLARLIEATEQPWPETRRLAAQASQNVEVTAGGSPLNQVQYAMCHLLLPLGEAMIEGGARTDASIRLVDSAIAVERYRREAGQPPRALEDLVPQYMPAVPSDPFDGQPLRYVLEDDAIVIYSIGQDDTDDGGNGDLSGEPDIVVRLPR